MTKLRLLFIIFIVCIALAIPISAMANGHAITLFLSYLPDLSNTGPTDAQGEARFDVNDGEFDLTVHGMPQLTDQVYEAWIVPPSGRAWVSLGRFNSEADGLLRYKAMVQNLPIQEYRYMLITVEQAQNDAAQPSGNVTVAAVFPNPAAVSVQRTVVLATPVGAHDATPVPVKPPKYLPETGGQLVTLPMWPIGLVLGAGFAFGAIRSIRR